MKFEKTITAVMFAVLAVTLATLLQIDIDPHYTAYIGIGLGLATGNLIDAWFKK